VSIRRFSKGHIILITEYKKGSAIRELLPFFSPFLYYSCGGGGVGKGGGVNAMQLHSSVSSLVMATSNRTKIIFEEKRTRSIARQLFSKQKRTCSIVRKLFSKRS
jgi:hypothetical protein